ncbi:MAG: DUF2239 family protein [Burkholderiales bacterium]
MNSMPSPTCTAFFQGRRVAFGTYAEVASALAAFDSSAGGLMVFDDASGALVDHPWPAAVGEVPAPVGDAAVPAPLVRQAPSVGRPKLGVVAREVTLLPRHWEWLAQQRGGASAALRRLVDEARRTHAEGDAVRQAKERSYRVMSAVAGELQGFEEAARALFATDPAALTRCMAGWPTDVQSYLAWLTRDAFASPAPADPANT